MRRKRREKTAFIHDFVLENTLMGRGKGKGNRKRERKKEEEKGKEERGFSGFWCSIF
jgi:hypothetical protein